MKEEIINTFNQPTPAKRRLALWLAIIFIAVAFGAGLWLGQSGFLGSNGQFLIKGVNPNSTSTFGDLTNANGKIPDYLTKDVDFSLFWDVWDTIKEKYYDKNIPDTQLFYGALAGLVDSLGDPHSIFLTAQDNEEFQAELNGNFEGIGAELGLRQNVLTVIAPLPDQPAMKAGLRPGDAILAINGEDALNMSLNDAVSKIRGPKGTKVTLKIYREKEDVTKEIEIIRDKITVKSLTWEFKDDIAYLKLRQFNNDTIPLFNDAILEILKNPQIKGIVLDLRNNPGGYLETAIDFAGQWLEDQAAVIEKYRDGAEYKYYSESQARLADYKTVVLINGGSASGSEIVAGALKDWGKATLVGEKTFGKGSVQEMIDLKNGSSIKLTIAKWFTPKGASIDGSGIEPDVKVEMTEDDYNDFNDPQLEKAMELVQQ